jgi:glyoxylase-like metal-dependent hydrolase (beta-lactamase superfamily II)
VSPVTHPWTAPPPAGGAVTIAPGIKWLRMPLPFALDHINLWLLADDSGWVAIDTGIGLPPTREAWERVFATELEGRPIGRVVVTHFHPDHMGNAAWLTERWGVDLWCTQAEWLAAQVAWRVRESPDLERRLAQYRRQGLTDGAVADLARRGNPYPRLVPALAPHFRALADGDTLTIGGQPWTVFTVHGHAPEHACLWNAEARILIAGDQVLPRITTNVSVWPEQPRANPLRLYLDSLRRFLPLPADTLVLPSHGLPFRGLHARLEALHEHHEARLAVALEALEAPRAGAELIPILFDRALDAHQLHFAIGEVLAHLHLLEAEGSVARLHGDDGIDRFVKA